jgi:glutathione S-transferase
MKLTYFSVRGRVEPARLLLALAGADYEFEGISVETWRTPEGKERFLKQTPFGQLPVLEDGGMVLCQSGAIHRYLARKLGFYGQSPAEEARVDEVFETGHETWVEIATACWNPQFLSQRAEHRAAMRRRFELLNTYCARTRADAEHWVLPGRYTLADAMMSYALEGSLSLHPGLLLEFPDLHHAVTTFFSTKGVREYVRSALRPRTLTVHLASFGGRPEETPHWTD